MFDRPRQRYPAVAALLSFLFPGLGQAYAGNRRLAALLALPVVALILAAIVAFALGRRQALNSLLSSSFLTAIIALDVALLVWRLFAIAQVGFADVDLRQLASDAVDARTESRTAFWRTLPARRIATVVLVVALLLATVGMHAWAGLVVGQLNATLGNVFSGGGRGAAGPGQHTGALNQPDYSWDGTQRINFLLLGIDAAPGREESLTDTILAVSVDPAAGTAVMISVPRDTALMPLPDRSVYPDGLYPNKINELSTEAGRNPALWCPDLPPDSGHACGLRTLERSVGLYLGIPLQYYATVDLVGFNQMIDALGGLTLCLPGKLVDPTYRGTRATWGRRRGVELPAGCSQYKGDLALAYARARKGYIEMPDGTRQPLDDFMRSERQQKVLLELRREFAQMDLIFELPRVLEAIGSTVATDFPRSKAGDLASLLPLITGPDIERVVLGLPRFVVPPADPLANYVLVPRRARVRAEMERLFGADTVEGWYIATNDMGPPAS